MTFTEFYQSIDWAPLERRGVMKFRTAHYLGWEVAKMGRFYEANSRAADSTDEPLIKTDTLEKLARWLFGKQAYLDGVYDPDKI